MGIAPLTLKPTYWKDFQIDDEDLEFLYNHLLEKETPLTPDELVALLVKERIQRERTALETRKTAAGAIYQPKDTYQVGQTLQFPQQDWGRGRVTSVREGNNPDLAAFEVIDVEMETGETHSFAAGLQNHKLNEMMSVGVDDPNLDAHHVLSTYGRDLTKTLSNNLEANPDLVRIAGRWFPRALLVDINIGHLNLAEAILEMADGGPLTTRSLMEQLDLLDRRRLGVCGRPHGLKGETKAQAKTGELGGNARERLLVHGFGGAMKANWKQLFIIVRRARIFGTITSPEAAGLPALHRRFTLKNAARMTIPCR